MNKLETKKPKFFSVIRAREYIMKNLDDGVICPCCEQLAKRYRRALYSTMSRQLIQLYWLVSDTGDYWHDYKEITGAINGGDFAKLRYWNLVVHRPNDDPNKKDSGEWSITDDGIAFVEGKLKIHKYIVLYDSCFEKFDGELIDIEQALGKKFSYPALMNRSW